MTQMSVEVQLAEQTLRMPLTDLNVQECDATDDEQRTKDGLITVFQPG